ncbi:restriction endonuclease subunit S [Phocaeicola coprophilus]|jgi:type I restriction enzyme S subunit|uniref:restriction endonuclease subunit S n=1 Tax=Phocaeicola coprophilus TaxID=387090 RepID=UPI003520BB2B
MDTKKLRQKILDLAIRGKLVPQDPSDEPASVLLERIKAEKERLIKEGKIKRSKKTAKTSDTPHYGNVPFEIPDNWEWCKLGDIVDFQGGYAYKSNTYVNQSDWQVIRIGNVKNDNLVLDTQPVFVEEVIGRETKKYLLQKDDILFTMTGTKGKRDYFYSVKVPSVKKKLLLNQRVGCLRRFSSEVNIDFLCFALKGEYVLDAIFSTETGNVSQGNIGSENTLNLNIAIPPLAEQRRIVSEIERWFSLIDIIENGKQDLQTTIKQAKNKILDLAIHGKLVPQDPNDEPASELLKRIKPKAEITCDNAHYPKVWQKTILGDIFNHNTGKALNSSNKEGIMKDYLTTSNVYWNKFDFSVIKQMPYKESELDKCTVTKGDLLVCEGGDIGRAAIWNYDFDICIQNHIHRLRPKGELCVAFYYYILLYLKENNLIGGKGIGLLGLSSNALHKIDVPLPPIEEQYRIVQKIEELFSYFDNIQKTLEA